MTRTLSPVLAGSGVDTCIQPGSDCARNRSYLGLSNPPPGETATLVGGMEFTPGRVLRALRRRWLWQCCSRSSARWPRVMLQASSSDPTYTARTQVYIPADRPGNPFAPAERRETSRASSVVRSCVSQESTRLASRTAAARSCQTSQSFGTRRRRSRGWRRSCRSISVLRRT